MTNNDRLKAYASFLNKFDMYICMQTHDKIAEAHQLIRQWSYAHRQGNGSLSDYQQKKLVDNVITKMNNF